MDRSVSWRVPGIDLAAEAPFRIGSATIDPSSREACFPGGNERLRPQTLKVLIALARRRGQVVTRADLVDTCWDGRVIGEDVINHSILLLRGFGERSGGFMIETVPKLGHRLVETPAPSRNRRRPTAAGVVALAAISAAFFISRDSRQAAPPTPSIAILPFDQSDPAAGKLAAETRVALSHTLSEGGFPVHLVTDGGNADLILTGDMRQTGEGVRATVRVELLPQRAIIYSQQFEAVGADAKILPERIGAQVGAAFSWNAALMALDRRQLSDPAISAQLIQNVAQSVQGGDQLKGYEIARSLAPKAPNSAIAQIGLAFETGLALGGIPRDQRPAAVAAGRRAANRVPVLAPEFGDIRASWCLLHSRTRLTECEDQLRLGMRTDPDAPFVPHFLSGLLDNVGRFDEAFQFSRLSLVRDRYKQAKIVRMLSALEESGRSDEADALYRHAARWWPGLPALALNRMAGMAERGDFDAVERFGKEIGQEELFPAGLNSAVKAKDAAAARKACPLETEPSVISIFCMIALAQTGDMDGAFTFADELYPRLKGRTPAETETLWLDNPDKPPFGILSAPAAAPMRRDPRFLAVADRLGLLAYWRNGRLPDFCRPPNPEPVCASLRPRRS